MIKTTNAKQCRKCGSIDSHIYESRQIMTDTGNIYVTRRRKCKQCGYKWKTIEVDYWDHINLIEGNK